MKEQFTHPKNVLVDMDGVLADFNGYLHNVLSSEHPRVKLPNPQTMFYLDEEVHPDDKPIIKEIISRPGFFSELKPIDGAIEGWGRLLELGYHPQICSAPLRKNETSLIDKRAWLEEYFVPRFGISIVDLAIFAKEKWLHKGLALIDDRPDPNYKNHEGINPAWQHIVYDQPYNKLSEAPFRMLSWEDPILPKILSQIEQGSI